MVTDADLKEDMTDDEYDAKMLAGDLDDENDYPGRPRPFVEVVEQLVFMTELPPIQKVILLALAFREDPMTTADLTEIGVTTRQVQYALRGAIRIGVVETVFVPDYSVTPPKFVTAYQFRGGDLAKLTETTDGH